MINKRKIQFKNIVKQFKPSNYLLAFLLIWLLFGIAYWSTANLFGGEDFIFQEDILLKSKNVAFQNEVHVNMNYSITKKLFLGYDDSFIPLKMQIINSPSVILYNLSSEGLKSIGYNWANYYSTKLRKEGYNFYNYKPSGIDTVMGEEKYRRLDIMLLHIPEGSYREISPNEIVTLKKDENYTITKSKKITIWLDEDMYNSNLNYIDKLGCDNQYCEIENINGILSCSVNYLDNDVITIANYQGNSGFKYPLIDFLYFSAVTITTLGYGDILPNSSFVRLLVMIETLCGAILIALFITSFYDWLNDTKNNGDSQSDIHIG